MSLLLTKSYEILTYFREKKIAENCLKSIHCFLLSDDQILNAMISQEIDGNK